MTVEIEGITIINRPSLRTDILQANFAMNCPIMMLQANHQNR